MNISLNYMVWYNEHEEFLLTLHKYCNDLSVLYKNQYLYKKEQLCYFKLPTIILTSFTGLLSIANTGYIKSHLEKYINLLVGIVNLITTTINIIENFKGINEQIVISDKIYHELIVLSNDISLLLSTPIGERHFQNGIEAVNNVYDRFSVILKESTILNNYTDNLLKLSELKFDLNKSTEMSIISINE